MSETTSYPLIRTVKRVLDVVRVLAIIALILWPLIIAALTLGKPADSDSWGVDIVVFSRFVVDVAGIGGDLSDSSGVRVPVFKGKASLMIDTSSVTALYIFAAITELGGLVGLYVLLQLRAVFASLAEGKRFDPDNARHIRNAGIVVTAWSIVRPVVQYFEGRAVLSDYVLDVPGIALYPAFELDLLALFIGVAMLVLAGVLNEAAAMHEEQRLTV